MWSIPDVALTISVITTGGLFVIAPSLVRDFVSIQIALVVGGCAAIGAVEINAAILGLIMSLWRKDFEGFRVHMALLVVGGGVSALIGGLIGFHGCIRLINYALS